MSQLVINPRLHYPSRSICNRKGFIAIKNISYIKIISHLISDDYLVSYAQHSHMYNEDLVKGNWICFSIWCSYVKNMEVNLFSFFLLIALCPN